MSRHHLHHVSRLLVVLAIPALAWFGTSAPVSASSSSAMQSDEGDIVLHARRAEVLAGGWIRVADNTAAGGMRLTHPDAGASKVSTAFAAPVHYFEISFDAQAGVPYRLWLRLRAERDYWGNDSVFVQFSGTVDASGSPAWRIGTSSSTTVNLEDCSGCGLSGWGWQDNGWGTGVLGPEVRFAATGRQTMRVQTREDGVSIDQIVLSPSRYLTAAPGALMRDSTILPESDATGTHPAVTVVRQPYLQQVTSTSAIVVWTTREPGPAEVRTTGPTGSSIGASATTTRFPADLTGAGFDYYQHVAPITGLTASTTYEYDILVGGEDANSGADRFTTAPEPGTGTAAFIAFGDSGTGSAEQRQLAALMAADTFDFGMHAGDIAYGASNGTGDATYQTMESWFFAIYKDWLRARPMFPSMGNHDSRASTDHGRAYLDMFVLPAHGATAAYPDHAERYYSFDYGPVHVVVLDTELAFQDTARRDAQLAWLHADLGATAQPWKIALFHRAPYSAGSIHGSDLEVRAAFSPVFEAYGVQLVIAAHEHNYQRSVPINGVTYIVTGGGGAPLYSARTASWTAASFSRHHYVRGAANECTLRLDAVGLDGSLFDTASLSRCASADTEPPSASITAPAHGASVAGNVRVAVAASDNVGVTRVELLVDGAPVATDSAAPYEFVWTSTSVPDGSHVLRARAFDAAGNVGLSGEVVVYVRNATSAGEDIVLHAARASRVAGGWRLESDPAAASGARVRHPDAGAAKRTTALAAPADFFELTFEADADVPYHLWVRSRADRDHWSNDSVFVQFTNVREFAIGTTSAAEVNLEDCSGCRLSGWGWQDNGWGVGVMGPHIVFRTAGPQTIRIQTREDGLAIDQVILSPSRFLTSSPGALKDDTTIYPEWAGGSGGSGSQPQEVVLYASDATALSGGWRLQADGAAADDTAVRHPDAGAAKRNTALAQPTDYVELTFQAEADVPYHLWIRSRADRDHWSNDSVFVQFTNVPEFAIGTTGATVVNLEDCSGCGISGWGWQDNGWGEGVMGPDIVFTTSGPQTLRVQTREDGLAIDQIVLSPRAFLSSSPGALRDDSTIVPKP